MALVLEGMVVWYFLLSLDEWFGGCLFVPVSYVALQNSGNSPASVSCSFFICYPEFWIFFFFFAFSSGNFPFLFCLGLGRSTLLLSSCSVLSIYYSLLFP